MPMRTDIACRMMQVTSDTCAVIWRYPKVLSTASFYSQFWEFSYHLVNEGPKHTLGIPKNECAVSGSNWENEPNSSLGNWIKVM
jgi:hypothetical protein